MLFLYLMFVVECLMNEICVNIENGTELTIIG